MSALRVTGRPETDNQVRAPWGYGDNFSVDSLRANSQALFSVAEKITHHFNADRESVDMRGLRDVTINYRYNSMFKLDPHIDPSDDGGSVFILSLKSDVVFTLTPDLSQLPSIFSEAQIQRMKDLGTPLRVRTSAEAVALHSWTDADVDIWLQPLSLLRISGPSRWQWRHAIRTGVLATLPVDEGMEGWKQEKQEEKEKEKEVVCDWWGDLSALLPRADQRISVIFAFR